MQGEDDHRILEANVARVFSERNAERRRAALDALYAPHAVFFEPDQEVRGLDAINDAVGQLLASLPPDVTFTPAGAAVGHHGLARLIWRAGPPDAPPIVTGMDVAHIRDGRIQTLHVFLDAPSPDAGGQAGSSIENRVP